MRVGKGDICVALRGMDAFRDDSLHNLGGVFYVEKDEIFLVVDCRFNINGFAVVLDIFSSKTEQFGKLKFFVTESFASHVRAV